MIDIQDIIFDNKMTVEERVLYAFLKVERSKSKEMLYYGYIKEEDVVEDGYYYTMHSNQELEKLLGCSKSKLIRVKKKLEERGLIIQKRTLDGSNKYFTFNLEVKPNEL